MTTRDNRILSLSLSLSLEALDAFQTAADASKTTVPEFLEDALDRLAHSIRNTDAEQKAKALVEKLLGGMGQCRVPKDQVSIDPNNVAWFEPRKPHVEKGGDVDLNAAAAMHRKPGKTASVANAAATYKQGSFDNPSSVQVEGLTASDVVVSPVHFRLQSEVVMSLIGHPVQVVNMSCNKCKSNQVWTDGPDAQGRVRLRCRFCGNDCGYIEPTSPIPQPKQQAPQPQPDPNTQAGDSDSLNIKASGERIQPPLPAEMDRRIKRAGLDEQQVRRDLDEACRKTAALGPDAHNTLPVETEELVSASEMGDDYWPICSECGQRHGMTPCGLNPALAGESTPS